MIIYMKSSTFIDDFIQNEDDIDILTASYVCVSMSIRRKSENDLFDITLANKTSFLYPSNTIFSAETIDDMRELYIEDLEEDSKNNTGLQFQIAINYGGRDEIVRMMRKTAEDVKNGKVNPEDINEEFISNNLDTKDIPDPDLLIRTSGEQRLSNFLLWQIAYSEFYIADCHWPDFNKDELIKAIEEYNKRDRRFGNAK